MGQPITFATLQFMKPDQLKDELLDPSSRTAVIDVRDSDYVGGHIKGGIRAPVNELDARMPELLRLLKDKDRVVFHCMLSQQRGPQAALAYARAKAAQNAKDHAINQSESNSANKASNIGGQEICVLEGGFSMWQSRYGTDKTLTEGYVKELWESVFA